MPSEEEEERRRHEEKMMKAKKIMGKINEQQLYFGFTYLLEIDVKLGIST